jgi:hypothetical protein
MIMLVREWQLGVMTLKEMSMIACESPFHSELNLEHCHRDANPLRYRAFA